MSDYFSNTIEFGKNVFNHVVGSCVDGAKDLWEDGPKLVQDIQVVREKNVKTDKNKKQFIESAFHVTRVACEALGFLVVALSAAAVWSAVPAIFSLYGLTAVVTSVAMTVLGADLITVGMNTTYFACIFSPEKHITTSNLSTLLEDISKGKWKKLSEGFIKGFKVGSLLQGKFTPKKGEEAADLLVEGTMLVKYLKPQVAKIAYFVANKDG